MKSPFRKNGGLIDGILFFAFAIAPYKTDRVLILLEFSYWVSNDDVSKMVVRKRGPFSWSVDLISSLHVSGGGKFFGPKQSSEK